MTKYIFPSIAVLLVASAQVAYAEPVKVWGAGADTCQKWQESQAKSENSELKQWLFGFVSAHNYYSTQQVQLPQAQIEAAYAHVARYCERHPSHGITAAAAAYVKSLGGQGQSPAKDKI
jgi:hypothetical protein